MVGEGQKGTLCPVRNAKAICKLTLSLSYFMDSGRRHDIPG